MEQDRLGPSPAAIDLLSAAVANEPLFDLGRFRAFSSAELCTIVSRLQLSGDMTALNPSNNPSIAEDDLCRILAIKSPLRTLYILGNNQISLTVIAKLTQDSE